MFDAVREFGAFLCERSKDSPETVERVRVVVQETLEAVASYAAVRESMRLTIVKKDEHIEVSVTSYDCDTLGRERLKRHVAQVSSLPPAEAFVGSLVGGDAESEEIGKLGLARMRYEAAFELAVEDEEGALRLSARGDA
jgi:hypothetical protein